MPDTSSVLNKFAVYGKIDVEDLEKYEPICEESLNDILSELRSDVDIKANRAKIVCISAALAFYKYALQQNAFIENDDITLGNLKVNSGNSISPESAYKFYMQTRISASNILSDNSFFAGKVAVV